MKRITVLVADSQLMFADALTLALEGYEELRVLPYHPTSGSEAVAAAAQTAPDVALFDYWLDGMDGPAVVRHVMEAAEKKRKKTRVVHLSWFQSDEHIEASLRAGSAGFLPKSVTVPELASAIRRAHAGDKPIGRPPGGSTTRTTSSDRPIESADGELARLTPRQLDVLRLMSAGLSSTQIGERLEITKLTAQTHIHNIISTIGVQSQLEAVVIARNQGLLP